MTEKIGQKFARSRPNFKTATRKRAMAAAFYGNPHTHGCAWCAGLVLLCRCQRPESDPLCVTCRLGRRRPWWPESHAPVDCCRYHATRISKPEKEQFLLAGRRDWFRCQECKRIFAFDPSDPANDPPIELEDWIKRYGPLPVPPSTPDEWAEALEDVR